MRAFFNQDQKISDVIKPWEVQTMRHGSFMIRTFNTNTEYFMICPLKMKLEE